MINPFQTFAVSGDAVFGLIAIGIWIWLSFVSRRNKTDPSTQPPPLVPTPGEPQSPQDELRKFFADLEKGINAPPAADAPEAPEMPPPRVPPPMPRRVVVRPAHRPAHPAPAMPPTITASVRAPIDAPPLAELPQLTALPEPRFLDPALVRGAQDPVSPAPGRPRLELLQSREGLQKAIVVSEVLGTPVGLRR